MKKSLSTRLIAALAILLSTCALWQVAQATVGRTAGQFGVSPVGTATYTVPLWAPPGPRGVQPTLALTYSSSQFNSYLGVGWSLSGLSVISRCPQTFAQDGAPASVALTYTDRFCLDGKRLRLTSSEDLATYGKDGTTYQTEIADFSNVTAHGASGNGPAYFTVQGKNGWLYQYGNGGNSQVLAHGSTTASTWWLNQVSDRAGNTMIITYQAANQNSNLEGTTVPASISWTPSSHGAATYNYTMTFQYQTLAFPSHAGYLAGTSVQSYYLLKNIQVQYGATTVKNYVLAYTSSATTGRETLTSLQECADAAATDCLFPTQMTYQPGQQGVTSSPTVVSAVQTQGLSASTPFFDQNFASDYNGDGHKDIAWYDGNGSQWKVAFGSTGGYGSTVGTGITSQTVVANAGNVDGTGLDGFLVPQSGVWWFYKWNGASFTGVSTGAPVDANTFGNTVTLADLNGDGLPDLVYMSSDNFLHVRLNTSTNGIPSFSSNSITTIPSGPANSRINQIANPLIPRTGKLDFYGSGQEDIVATGSYRSGSVVYTFLSVLHFTGTTFTQSIIFNGPDQIGANHFVDVGNYNDDNCPDVLTTSFLYLSACNGTAAAILSLNGDVSVNGLDWDGSGHKSVLVRHNTGSGTVFGIYKTMANTLSGLITTNIQFPPSQGVEYAVLPNPAGDGFDALAAFNYAATPGAMYFYPHNGAGQPPDLLSSVTDGYGNSASSTYVSIAQNNYSPYFNATNPDQATYPDRNYVGPLYVVNQATFSDPTTPPNGTYQQTFWYYDAWMNLQGRGFGGFKQVGRHDLRNGVWDTVGYAGAFPASGAFAFDLTSWDQAGNQVIRYSWANVVNPALDSTPNNQRYFVYDNSTTIQTYEVGGTKGGQLINTVTTSYTFDNYGNATNVTTSMSDDDSGSPASPYAGERWTRSTATSIIPDTSSNWCLNMPSQQAVTYTAPGTPAITRTVEYQPDYVNCRENQQVVEPGNTTYAVTQVYDFDAFGNVKTVSATGAKMTQRQSTIDWGATGQVPMITRDPSGATAQFNYDFRYGLPSSVTDPNNLTTSWIFDNYGRQIQENRPDGTSTAWNWPASISCQPPYTGCGLLRNVVLRHDLDTANNTISTSTVELDPLDRPFELEYVNLTGSASTVEIRYDSLGRIASQSAPFIWGATQYFETYYYDALNRITHAQRPVSAANSSPQTTGYQYLGDTTIITDANGHQKTLIADVNGWLRQTKDATGYTIILGYDAAGSQTTTADSLSNTLWSGTYQYGISPFLVTSNDADLGAWTYAYNALGELTGWTDAKQQSFSAAYDVLSRMTDRYEPDLYTHWTWGTGTVNSQPAYNIGQLQAVCTGTGTNPTTCTPSSGYAENETYDRYGRPFQRSIQIPADATYTYTLGYNATTGYLDTLTYPATSLGPPLQLKYGYANGFLQSITNVSDSPNVPLWTGNAVDAAGNFLQETLGNHVVVNHSFDALTSWVSSITAGLNGGAALQNNSYLFDNVGNLTQRQDNNAGLTESVYYDALNRLDHTVGDTNTQHKYDAIGRLDTWAANGGTPNVNNYTTAQSGCPSYANSQLHALRQKTQGTGAGSYCYDADGNMTAASWRGSPVMSTTWTSYNQPNLITGGWPNLAAPGVSSSQFFYDQDHQRWKQVASYSGSPETTEYIGGLLEKMTNSSGTAYRHYIPAGSNSIVYTRWSTGSNPTYYVTGDHLGSSAVITDQTGAALVSEKFSALGWNENTSAQQATMATVTRHEFTGQEGLDNAGLWMVNMNGRVYVPSGSFFLSPDPYLPNPTNTQDYNRYSYADFNPLTYTDPTGFDSPASCADDAGACGGSGGTDSAAEVVISSSGGLPQVGDTATNSFGDSFQVTGVTAATASDLATVLVTTNVSGIIASPIGNQSSTQLAGMPNQGGNFASSFTGGPGDVPSGGRGGSGLGTGLGAPSYRPGPPSPQGKQSAMGGLSGLLYNGLVQPAFGWIDCAGGRCSPAQEAGRFISPILMAAPIPGSITARESLSAIRGAYLQGVDDLVGAGLSMRAAGASAEQAARALAPLRNQLKLDLRAQGSWLAARAADLRNLIKYGNRAGPSADDLLRQYGSWERVLDALGHTSDAVNRAFGVGGP
jgi:RHS repeat-associated protein